MKKQATLVTLCLWVWPIGSARLQICTPSIYNTLGPESAIWVYHCAQKSSLCIGYMHCCLREGWRQWGCFPKSQPGTGFPSSLMFNVKERKCSLLVHCKKRKSKLYYILYSSHVFVLILMIMACIAQHKKKCTSNQDHEAFRGLLKLILEVWRASRGASQGCCRCTGSLWERGCSCGIPKIKTLLIQCRKSLTRAKDEEESPFFLTLMFGLSFIGSSLSTCLHVLSCCRVIGRRLRINRCTEWSGWKRGAGVCRESGEAHNLGLKSTVKFLQSSQLKKVKMWLANMLFFSNVVLFLLVCSNMGFWLDF